MINPADFQPGELEATVAKLQAFKADDSQLAEQVQKYFNTYDNDGNAHLDRCELRQFLHDFFTEYHMHVPITDEYVDAVFRSIDKNHDNKIQPEELIEFAKTFINRLIVDFTAVAAGGAEE